MPFHVEVHADMHLSSQDRVRVVEDTVQCGKVASVKGSGPSVSTPFLTGVLANNPHLVGEVGSTGVLHTSLRWGPVTVMRAGRYAVCLCAGLGVTCSEDRLFSHTAGVFTVSGPKSIEDDV